MMFLFAGCIVAHDACVDPDSWNPGSAGWAGPRRGCCCSDLHVTVNTCRSGARWQTDYMLERCIAPVTQYIAKPFLVYHTTDLSCPPLCGWLWLLDLRPGVDFNPVYVHSPGCNLQLRATVCRWGRVGERTCCPTSWRVTLFTFKYWQHFTQKDCLRFASQTQQMCALETRQ